MRLHLTDLSRSCKKSLVRVSRRLQPARGHEQQARGNEIKPARWSRSKQLRNKLEVSTRYWELRAPLDDYIEEQDSEEQVTMPDTIEADIYVCMFVVFH